jgi:biopolymer transport protein TolR
MAMKAGGGSGDELNSEINVTPMVDVMLVLLIIFMITSSIPNEAVDLQLPQTKASAIDDPNGKLVLEIKADRSIKLGTTPVTWHDLEIKLSTNERLKAESALYIAADTNLPYGVVVTAMAVAKNAGVSKVMMLTDPSTDLKLDDLDKPASH